MFVGDRVVRQLELNDAIATFIMRWYGIMFTTGAIWKASVEPALDRRRSQAGGIWISSCTASRGN